MNNEAHNGSISEKAVALRLMRDSKTNSINSTEQIYQTTSQHQVDAASVSITNNGHLLRKVRSRSSSTELIFEVAV